MGVKKGQVVGYILLGVALILIIGSILFIRSSVREGEIDIQQERILKSPTQQFPLQTHVEQCLEKVGLEALQIAGKHGGHVEYQRFSENNFAPYTAQSLTDDFSNMKIPYWYYAEGNDCVNGCPISSEMPTLNEVEDQFETYIDNQIEKCVDFTQFPGLEIKASTPKSSVIIQDQIILELDWPIEIVGEAEQTLQGFDSTINVNLKKIFEMGKLIVEGEIETHFLENHVFNVMSTYMGTGNEDLPPSYDFDPTPGPATFWLKSEVEEKIQNEILPTHLGMLQILGTDNYRPRSLDSPFQQGLYSMADLPILQGSNGTEENPRPHITNSNYSYFDTSVRFSYLPSWPVYLKMNSASGGGDVITADNGPIPGFISSIVGMNKYLTLYDISYPIMIEINDQNALDGDGYTFYFAIEGNIRQNTPLTSDGVAEILQIRSDELLCQEEQRGTGRIQVNVVDKFSGEGIDTAEILYQCGDIQCKIGYTRAGIYAGEFPICLGGKIIANGFGYSQGELNRSMLLGDTAELEINLFAEKTVELEVIKKQVVLTKVSVCFLKKQEAQKLNPPQSYACSVAEQSIFETQWSFNDQEVSLLPYEQAIINVNSEGIQRSYVYDPQRENTITLVPGLTSIDAQLLYELPNLVQEAIVVPEDIREEGGVFDSTEVVLPEIVLNGTMPTGGVKLIGENKFLITEELYDSTKFTILVVQAPGSISIQDETFTHEDMAIFGESENYARNLTMHLQPRFS